MSVWIGPAGEHPVFLNQPETRRCLPSSRQNTLPSLGTQGSEHRGTLTGDTGAPCEDVERYALAQEDLANGAAYGGAVLDRCDCFPFLDVPFNSSNMLRVSLRVVVRQTYVQPSCEKTSSKNGTPATMPFCM